MSNNNNQTFSYNYSAMDREEIKAIRKKYSPLAEEDKMTRLRRLDASVTQKASTVSLVLGIVGALVLGLGMSLLLSELGDILSLDKKLAIALGLGVGIVGLCLVASAYPSYNRIVKKQREKLSAEILRLTDELLM